MPAPALSIARGCEKELFSGLPTVTTLVHEQSLMRSSALKSRSSPLKSNLFPFKHSTFRAA
jgi:hypothetical protein